MLFVSASPQRDAYDERQTKTETETETETERETERDRERKGGGGMTLRCADGRVVINANGSIYISRRITSHNASTI